MTEIYSKHSSRPEEGVINSVLKRVVPGYLSVEEWIGKRKGISGTAQSMKSPGASLLGTDSYTSDYYMQ